MNGGSYPLADLPLPIRSPSLVTATQINGHLDQGTYSIWADQWKIARSIKPLHSARGV